MESSVPFPAVKALQHLTPLCVCTFCPSLVLHLPPVSLETPQFQYWKIPGAATPWLPCPAAYELLMHVYNFSPLTLLFSIEKSQIIME